MNKKTELIGQKYGRLTIVEFYEIRGHNSYWLCKCDCGNEKITTFSNLKRDFKVYVISMLEVQGGIDE